MIFIKDECLKKRQANEKYASTGSRFKKEQKTKSNKRIIDCRRHDFAYVRRNRNILAHFTYNTFSSAFRRLLP
jgi:hypothetical protein